nr:SIR2 family protein [Plantibacter sp. CFBP 8798]
MPTELLEAHANGKLVLFVGAGASMGAPSNLPSFRDLARQLARAARVPFNDDFALDLFLGSMPTDFETHAHARRIIAHPGSTYNPTHTALVKLASALGAPRIVTTNFDSHLSTASTAALLPDDDLWVGPALPLGDDFSGIVHLHGSVQRPPAQLVLTDRDFGRAYLTDAWATRFLQRMFDEFTVLFVGYSHDDPIMRYLALGLPSKTRRYVLTHLPEDDKWSHLGIVPVSYPAVENDHSALLLLLEEWDRRARMGGLEHQRRMKEVVEAGPPLNPVDEDYVRQRLESSEGALHFTGFARSVAWLRWVESVDSFQRLFTGGQDTAESSVLGDWFGQAFVADPSLHTAALQTVQRLGSRFSPRIYQSLSWATESLMAANPGAGRRWKVLLATSIVGTSSPPDLGMLMPYEPLERSEEMALLRVALRPFLILKPHWAMDRDDPLVAPTAEATWHVEDEVLTRHVRKMIEDRAAGDSALGALLEDALGGAYDLLEGYDGPDKYDTLSSRRSAIEPHTQDEFRHSVDALIDGLRDYGAKALLERPETPERWWARGSTLFQRLALHLMRLSTTRGSDQKLDWVLERRILFESPLKHEVFRLVASTVPEASPDRLDRVLQAALEGPVFADDVPDGDRHRAYSVYNLLVWLTQSNPSWASAQRERDRLEMENPTFGPREFPDLDSWSGGATWGETLPMEVESFVRDLESDAEMALTALIDVDYSERRIDGPTWDGALTLVSRAAERDPSLGQRLWSATESRPMPADRKDDLREAIIEGWVHADLGECLNDVVILLASRVNGLRSPRGITMLLVSQIEKNLDTPESASILAMRGLARAVWDKHRGSFEQRSDSSPSSLALNSWPGDLTRYWILEINRRWRELGEAWTGLNDLERETIEAMLVGSGAELDAIRPALGGQAYFMSVADPTFAQRHVLPLFNGPFASQAWEAYLHRPRYNDQMLFAGFLQSTIAEWEHLDGVGGRRLREQFYGLVASVVSIAGIAPEQRQELLDSSVLAGNGEHAPEFASAVMRFFKDDTVDSGALWNRWARDHLTERLQGLPRNARPGELERWADIAPFVGEHTGEAFSMLSHFALWEGYRAPQFPADLLATNGSALVDHLAERIRNSSPSGRATSYAVRKLITDLKAALGVALCAPLLEAAIATGFRVPGPSAA